MRNVKNVLVDVFGWWGTIAIVGAYILNSFGIISAHSIYYQLLNLTGAAGIITVSLSKKVYQPVVLNTVWLIVAAVAIAKSLL